MAVVFDCLFSFLLRLFRDLANFKGVAGTVSLLIFFRFFPFFPFSSVFPCLLSVYLRFLPFRPFFIYRRKNGETPFARPLWRNADSLGKQAFLSSLRSVFFCPYQILLPVPNFLFVVVLEPDGPLGR